MQVITQVDNMAWSLPTVTVLIFRKIAKFENSEFGIWTKSEKNGSKLNLVETVH